MQVTFLAAPVSLSKTFHQHEKKSYPNAYEFTSYTQPVNNLEHFKELLVAHANMGHCLLKGNVNKQLTNESRAGSTSAFLPTDYICLDIDHISSAKDIEAVMTLAGLKDVSYILQWSASYGVYNDFSLRAHVFVLLKSPVAPASLKLWLRELNLTAFVSDLSLTKTENALSWGLDITTCQNDKLLFITPPICTPKSIDHFVGDRICLVRKSTDFFDFSLAQAKLKSAEAIKELEQEAINRLRRNKGLTERKASQFKLKEYKGEAYLSSPDTALVTGRKEERGFVYLNLNNGDSWGYYHPLDDATFIKNFKGEPTYRTSELLPDYWESARRSVKAEVAALHKTKTFLAFRDLRSSDYYNGWYDERSQELVLHIARSEKQVADFLANYGQYVPDVIPIWDIAYDPKSPPIDVAAKCVNTFVKSTYMQAADSAPKPPNGALSELCPVTYKLISHVVGESMTDHFVNWLAFCFMHRVAPKTAWILHGTQGTGKGLLNSRVFTPLFGKDNIVVRRMEELEDKFNDYVEGSLLICIDEAQISDSGRNKMIMANVKNWITEPTITVRKMRQSSYEITNHAGWIFASNMPDPVVVDSSDRRFNVGEYQPNALSITDAELDNLVKELDIFADYLATYAIRVEDVRTPKMNEAKEQMMMVSRPSADVVADALRQGNLAVLWDALPTIETTRLPLNLQVKVEPYKALLYDIILNDRDRLSRDEIGILFDYNVGNVNLSPWKLTSYLKHHNLSIRDIRINNQVQKGVVVEWKNSDSWFEARRQEISLDQPKLRAIKKAS